MAETLISMVVFIPLFLSIPVLGKYMDIKQKALEATRYAAWERTIWAGDNGIGWGDGQVNIKSMQEVITEIDRRFYGHPLQGLDDSRQTENPLWGTRQGGEDIRFLGRRASDAQDTDNVTALRAELPRYESRPPGYDAGIVDAVANGGDFGGGALDGISTNGIPGIGSDCEVPGVDFDTGLFLGRSNRVNLMLETPINNVLGQPDLVISTRAGILSNAWVVPRDSEDFYKTRVGRITASEPLSCFVAIIGELSPGVDEPLFGEARRATPSDTLAPAALPQERRINNNERN